MVWLMAKATDVQQIRPGLFLWDVYDPAVKAELFSTGIRTDTGVYLVDPIPLDEDALGDAFEPGSVSGIIVTNENHARAAAEFAACFDVCIYAHKDALPALESGNTRELLVGRDSPPGLQTTAIEGAPAGEIAIYCERDGGTLVIGDALINFGSHEFDLLPAKYCTDPRQMRRSLRQLLDFDFERMLFAHGTPIVKNAHRRLAELLDAQP